MRTRPLLAVVLTVAAAVAVPLAQSRPDFTGTWVVVSPADAAGQEETLAQEARTLAMGHASEGGHHRRTYRLDGTETKWVLQSHGEDVVTTSRAVWEGTTLVITAVTQYPGDRILDARHTLSLTTDGQLKRTFAGRLNGEPVPAVETIATRKR